MVFGFDRGLVLDHFSPIGNSDRMRGPLQQILLRISLVLSLNRNRMNILQLSQKIIATTIGHRILGIAVDIHPIVLDHLGQLRLHISQFSPFVLEELKRGLAHGGFGDMLAYSVLNGVIV